jgi:hypothetical protein
MAKAIEGSLHQRARRYSHELGRSYPLQDNNETAPCITVTCKCGLVEAQPGRPLSFRDERDLNCIVQPWSLCSA